MCVFIHEINASTQFPECDKAKVWTLKRCRQKGSMAKEKQISLIVEVIVVTVDKIFPVFDFKAGSSLYKRKATIYWLIAKQNEHSWIGAASHCLKNNMLSQRLITQNGVM